MIACHQAWVHAGQAAGFTPPNGFFRDFGFCPFRGQVRVSPAAGLPRTFSAGLHRAAGYPGKERRDFPLRGRCREQLAG